MDRCLGAFVNSGQEVKSQNYFSTQNLALHLGPRICLAFVLRALYPICPLCEHFNNFSIRSWHGNVVDDRKEPCQPAHMHEGIFFAWPVYRCDDACDQIEGTHHYSGMRLCLPVCSALFRLIAAAATWLPLPHA
eukprot:805350-Pelagomonas_calceolata.AAC.7